MKANYNKKKLKIKVIKTKGPPNQNLELIALTEGF